MAYSDDEAVKSMVKVIDALLQGDFEKKADNAGEAGVIYSSLAGKINQMAANMKKAEAVLSNAGERTPLLADNFRNIIKLMSQSTEEVLSKADILTGIAEELEAFLEEDGSADRASARSKLENMKAAIYDIIASQSYQDAARQQMETISKELNQIRDWLLETMVALNINRDNGSEDLQQKEMREGRSRS
ncbi:MAG: hypothetical protein ACQES8_00770, partial [Thermodesulfobacteriota bacterium]